MDAGREEHPPPPVPMKTYRWEDVRRQRQAGVYPWTHVLKGPYDEKAFLAERDHEYEPISPMASQPIPPPVVKVTDMETEDVKRRSSVVSSNDSNDHLFLRIPLHGDDEIKGEDEEDKVEEDERDEGARDEDEEEMTAQEYQNRMEARFFAATPTTTESRTDCEINTSQVDSSGLDELPLKKDARQASDVRGIQSRIRSQAGRLRQKIRNISRPKISLPDKPKFKLPERPKISLPERPKLKLPERPKLKLPERPKINFPQRPKISMPNFNFGKTKTSSIRRPLRDRAQVQSDQSSSTGSKKNIFDSFRTYPRIFKKKKAELSLKGKRAQTPPPRMETESSPPSTPASRKNQFTRHWSERYKDIKFADDESQSEKQKSFDDDVEDDTAPFRDTEFTGAINLEEPCKPLKASSSGSIPASDKEQRSSGSSSDRLRAGVIEEIDSDEFFLREKGLSREDVDVSRYLSLEIRDAFRSPKNALARLDTDLYDDEDYDLEAPIRKSPTEPIRRSMEAMRCDSIEPIRMTPEPGDIHIEPEPEVEPEPSRPTRTRSLKKYSNRSKSEDITAENQFNTFPPSRPIRGRKQSIQSKQSLGVDDLNDMDVEDKENIPQDIIRQPSIPSLAITDTTRDPSPTRYIDESSEALNWPQEHQPPLPPKRRKSSSKDRRDNDSLNIDHYENEKWAELIDAQTRVPEEITALQLEATNEAAILSGYYDSPPLPPNRKQRSRGTSLADEDRTSRGAESLISETRDPNGDEILQENVNRSRPIYDDYAVVEKPSMEVKRHLSLPRPPRPPPPSRRKKTTAQIIALKNQGINFFFTYPRRAMKSLQKEMPVRPVRNYSTIPSRPPRRNRVFREPVYVESEIIPLKDENEQNDLDLKSNDTEEKIKNIELESSQVIENIKALTSSEDDIHELRDLQSGDVIEKMKGRPLPPPPRPPRKSKDDSTSRLDDDFRDESLDIQVTDLDEPDEEVIVQRLDICITPNKKEQFKEDTLVTDLDDTPTVFSDIMHLPTVVDKPIVVEPPVKVERKRKSLSQPLNTSSMSNETVIKVEDVCVSTQTEPLSEKYQLEQQQRNDMPELQRQEQERVKHIETIVEKQVIVMPSPDTEISFLKAQKLQVSELDVDKLNVNELQAQKIVVSDIDGVTMQVSELSTKSGHLVINGIELPPSFLETLIATSQTTEQTQSSTQTAPPPLTIDSQTNTTPTVAIPEPVIQSTERTTPSIIVESPQSTQTPLFISSHVSTPSRSPHRSHAQASSSQLDSEEEMTMVPSRRRRHHSHKHSNRFSSDEEEEEDYAKQHHVSHVARRHPQQNARATELIRQLVSIWQENFMTGVNRVVDGVNVAFPEGEKRKDAQTAACILLVLVAGLIMLGFGQDKTVHHHHWDFIPPHP